MGGDEAIDKYEICAGANLTCMNDLLNRMCKLNVFNIHQTFIPVVGEFDHVDHNGKEIKCMSACEDQVLLNMFRLSKEIICFPLGKLFVCDFFLLPQQKDPNVQGRVLYHNKETHQEMQELQEKTFDERISKSVQPLIFT